MKIKTTNSKIAYYITCQKCFMGFKPTYSRSYITAPCDKPTYITQHIHLFWKEAILTWNIFGPVSMIHVCVCARMFVHVCAYTMCIHCVHVCICMKIYVVPLTYWREISVLFNLSTELKMYSFHDRSKCMLWETFESQRRNIYSFLPSQWPIATWQKEV